VRERICTEKRKKKQITVVKQQKQVRGGAAEADPVEEEKLFVVDEKQVRWRRSSMVRKRSIVEDGRGE